MIFDQLEHLQQYGALPQNILRAIDYLSKTDFNKVEDGKHVLDGERLFAMVQSYKTHPLAEARWEAHRCYIDVQYLVSGNERMGHLLWRPSLAVAEPYDASRDVIFFKGPGNILRMQAGDVAIFLPHDIHAPGVAVNDVPADVRKIVVKCRID